MGYILVERSIYPIGVFSGVKILIMTGSSDYLYYYGMIIKEGLSAEICITWFVQQKKLARNEY